MKRVLEQIYKKRDQLLNKNRKLINEGNKSQYQNNCLILNGIAICIEVIKKYG